MLKYAVKEDYESAKTDINLIPIILDYIQPESKNKNGKQMLPKTMKQTSKKK